MYADDLILIMKGPLISLKINLESIFEIIKRFGMNPHNKKTKYKKELKDIFYLGIWLEKNTHLEYNFKKVEKSLETLNRLFQQNKLNNGVKITSFKALILSQLYYGLEIFDLKQNDFERIDRFINKTVTNFLQINIHSPRLIYKTEAKIDLARLKIYRRKYKLIEKLDFLNLKKLKTILNFRKLENENINWHTKGLKLLDLELKVFRLTELENSPKTEEKEIQRTKKFKNLKKSKELVLLEKCGNWTFEEFDKNTDPQNLEVINDISDFRDNFSSADSFHFATYHSKRGYFVFSVLDLDNEEEELLVMCNSAEDCETKAIKISDLKKPFSRTITCRGPGIKSIVGAFDSSFSSFKAVNCSQHHAEQELLDMEQFYNINQFKFGVLYIKEGQTKEQEYLSNTDPSQDFLEFLDLLGEEIELEGWGRYKGGLDTKRGTCGEKSYFTEWNSFEIMFHVSTCFPYEENDDQQVNRKRHIGNDVTIIVYLEPGATFNPEGFASMQSHVIIAVEPLPNKKKQYR
ncbi:gtpase-activating rap/ran-gap domain-like protein [Anaeramoeba flamelloides]|uniref:Gtpase-activating rap/ran-gap domain-like protein n=1 Tax=Anaeramoeba flamelloides TaxID=1746091 RepID=A0AAV7ZNM3_9EUKA|nr:gtpase-activating rap/ran-gap domain-like protein [Anaeramoeba flamelloides]